MPSCPRLTGLKLSTLAFHVHSEDSPQSRAYTRPSIHGRGSSGKILQRACWARCPGYGGRIGHGRCMEESTNTDYPFLHWWPRRQRLCYVSSRRHFSSHTRTGEPEIWEVFVRRWSSGDFTYLDRRVLGALFGFHRGWDQSSPSSVSTHCSGSSPRDYGSSRSTHEPDLPSSTVQVHRSTQYRIFAVHFLKFFLLYIYVRIYCCFLDIYIYYVANNEYIFVNLLRYIYLKIMYTYMYILSYKWYFYYLHYLYIQHCGAGTLSWSGSWSGHHAVGRASSTD